MEKFDIMYDNLSGLYFEIENMMDNVYRELQTDPTNIDKVNFLQGLGSVALKVISSQQLLVESYSSIEFKDTLLARLDEKTVVLKDALEKDKYKSR